MGRPGWRSLAILVAVAAFLASRADAVDTWVGDLSPISAADWNCDRAAHLLERAGFGGTPEDIEALAAMTPEAREIAGISDRLVRFSIGLEHTDDLVRDIEQALALAGEAGAGKVAYLSSEAASKCA